MGKTTPILDVTAWRGRDDDVAESSTSFTHALNTDWDQTVDQVFRIRAEIEETAGADTTGAFRLEYSLNSAAFTAVPAATADTDPVMWAPSHQVTPTTTTNVLTAATSTFNAGRVYTGHPSTTVTVTKSEHTEIEWCLIVPSGAVDDGDTIEFQVVTSDTSASWSDQALGTITVDKTSPATLTSHGFLSGNNQVVTLPNGWADGDEAILVVEAAVTTQTLTTPTGWTLRGSGPNDGAGSDERAYLFTRTLASGDSGPTLTWSASVVHIWGLIVIPGAGSFDTATVATPASSATPSITGVSVSGSDSTVITTEQRDPANAGDSSAVPSGFTEVFRGGFGNSGHTFGVGLKTGESSGTKSYQWSLRRGSGTTADTTVLYAVVYASAAGGVTVPCQAADAQSAATLSLTAKTQVPLGSSDATSTTALALTAKTEVSLDAAAAQSAATLALATPVEIPADPAAATSAATLSLSAPTAIAASASAQSTAALELSAPALLALTADAVTTAALALSATTAIPLDPSDGQSAATLDLSILSSEVELPLNASDAQSAATLALTAKTEVSLDPAAAQSAATLDLNASTELPLDSADAQSAATLDLTATPKLALTADATSTATLALSAKTEIPLDASAAQSAATMELQQFEPIFTSLTAAATSAATLALTAETTIPLDSADATSAATLALTAPTEVPLDPAAATSTGALALSATTEIPLDPSAATSDATLDLTIEAAAQEIPLDPAVATSAAALSLTAPTEVPLDPSAASSSATLALHGTPKFVLTATGASGASLSFTVPTAIPLDAAAAVCGAILALAAPTELPLDPSAGQSAATATVTIFQPWVYGGDGAGIIYGGDGSGMTYGGEQTVTYGGTADWTYDADKAGHTYR
jgi:hypothetical protein